MLDLLLPTTCPSCGSRGPAPCARCWRALEVAPPGPPPRGVDVCRALLRYEGTGRELLARLKYRNARSVVPWLATAMAALAAPVVAAGTVVTWAPTSATRRRARRFDQAEVLARAVARELDLPVVALLKRRPGPPQTGRSARQRTTAVAFDLRRGCASPATVLVVDDVLTTGATIAAAAAALRAAGAARVLAVTAARTPLKLVERPADA